MSNHSVYFFGVGDGEPCADRGHSSTLYQLDDATLLIDCGEPVSSRYKASGRSYDDVDRLILSHMHFDHIGGFFMLIQGFWLEGRKKDLTVHMTQAGIEPVRQLLQAACIFDEVLPFRLTFEPLQDQTPIETKTLRITPSRTSHLDGFRKRYEAQHPGHYEAYSFLIETENHRIAHSADVGRVEDLEPLLEKPLDLLVCELAHFKPETLFQRLTKADIKKIILTHVGRSHWENLDQTRQLAQSFLPEDVLIIAEEQKTIPI